MDPRKVTGYIQWWVMKGTKSGCKQYTVFVQDVRIAANCSTSRNTSKGGFNIYVMMYLKMEQSLFIVLGVHEWTESIKDERHILYLKQKVLTGILHNSTVCP
jgi:hypothetical protein